MALSRKTTLRLMVCSCVLVIVFMTVQATVQYAMGNSIYFEIACICINAASITNMVTR